MKRLIIADSHLGQRVGDAQEMTELLQRAVDSGVGEVIYLGDAFQYLVGLSKLWTETVCEMLRVWQRHRENGLRLVLVEGNRDFFLDEPDVAVYLDWAGRIYEFTAGPRRFRLVHGDLVNQRDLQYRFWSSLSKSTGARLLAHLMPQKLAVAIVRRMEEQLARTNIRYRKRKPVLALIQQADEAWAAGVDMIMWGHFHSFWQHRDGDRVAMVVPAWLSTSASVLVEPDGSWSWVDLALSPLDSTPPVTRL